MQISSVKSNVLPSKHKNLSFQKRQKSPEAQDAVFNEQKKNARRLIWRLTAISIIVTGLWLVFETKGANIIRQTKALFTKK